MSILLISDLHLNEERPDITEAFISFLQHKTADCEVLYILGDFFDIWVGDDNMGDFEFSIANHLAELSKRGVKIYLMHGNRDFALGRGFCKLANCQLIKDPMLTHFYGTPVLLTHGDILCTMDVSYQRQRRFYRNPFILFLLKSLPLKFRQNIAEKLRAKSRMEKKDKAIEIMDVTPQAVVELLMCHDVQWLIHGHTHRPAIHELEVGGKPVKRIVLGDWEPYGVILKVTPDNFSLESINQ